MDKPILLDAILEQDEKWIEETFPDGALRHEGKNGKPDRFSPCQAGEKADKTLSWLKREKRKRREKPLFMLAGSPQPRLRWSKKEKRWKESDDWGVEEHGYTHSASKALDDEGPGRKWLETEAKQNWQQFLGGLEAVDTRHPRLYVQRRIHKKAA